VTGCGLNNQTYISSKDRNSFLSPPFLVTTKPLNQCASGRSVKLIREKCYVGACPSSTLLSLSAEVFHVISLKEMKTLLRKKKS
jgi:hypothetical protein